MLVGTVLVALAIWGSPLRPPLAELGESVNTVCCGKPQWPGTPCPVRCHEKQLSEKPTVLLGGSLDSDVTTGVGGPRSSLRGASTSPPASTPVAAVRPKVFFIGFHKTGTSTYTNMFKRWGFSVQHRADWWYWRKPELFDSRVDVLVDGYERYSAADLPHLDPTWFNVEAGVYPDVRWLQTTFPGCKLFLNTRPLREWMTSRVKHCNMDEKFKRVIENGMPKGFTLTDLMLRWIDDRNRYFAHLRPLVESGEVVVANIRDPHVVQKLANSFDPPLDAEAIEMSLVHANKLADTSGSVDVVDAFLRERVAEEDWKSDFGTVQTLCCGKPQRPGTPCPVRCHEKHNQQHINQ